MRQIASPAEPRLARLLVRRCRRRRDLLLELLLCLPLAPAAPRPPPHPALVEAFSPSQPEVAAPLFRPPERSPLAPLPPPGVSARAIAGRRARLLALRRGCHTARRDESEGTEACAAAAAWADVPTSLN